MKPALFELAQMQQNYLRGTIFTSLSARVGIKTSKLVCVLMLQGTDNFAISNGPCTQP